MIQYSDRKYLIGGLILLSAFILIARLFYLQVIDTSYKLSASSNALQHRIQYPARGLIYDRNNRILVANKAAYDLMVTPIQVKPFDTAELCQYLDISKNKLLEGLRTASHYSRYKPSIVVKQITAEQYAFLQEKMFKYQGFYVQTRTLREYTTPLAAHILGYVGEVDEKQVKENQYYKMGDYIGKSGVEKTYEDQLRGVKGVKIYLVDVHNRIKGSYMNGWYDKPAVVGKDIYLTIDSTLQAYGEKLMQNKSGSIVAIEPSTGEILALVSSPTYHPALLVGRQRASNYAVLKNDTAKPLFNRATMAKYPPGSTFKIMNALVALQDNLINRHTKYTCYYGYKAGPIFVSCHDHPTPLNLPGSIQCSCNAYYCNVFRRILTPLKNQTIQDVYTHWRDYVVSFGFGNSLGSDLANELNGYIPTVNYYNRYYGKTEWSALTVISLGIGQGELGITPLQMANFTASLANRGYYITPHIVKKVRGITDSTFSWTKKKSRIDPENFQVIIEGMELAVNGAPNSGSTARIARLDSVIVCGKTGTAENPHGDDHSIFICFAPKDNPVIAMAVYVENAGFGASWAAPIASLMIEQYLQGKTKRQWLEDYVIRFEKKKDENTTIN